ncbi:carbohydrate ABC transporter permease [Mycoplasma nasistruthionis]|uniref:carbohydrate ABC transporter permease n=1 Tax=Mycoplasma nasistruthionis TaxID=353852 RepID=UPI0030B7FB5E
MIQRKLRKNQERVSSQVTESNLGKVILTSSLKLLLLSFFGVVILFPFIYMISISFMNDSEAASLKTEFRFFPSFSEGVTYLNGGFVTKPWSEVVANTYARAFATGYWSAITLTLLNVVISVSLKVIITFLMGYAFSLRNWRGKGLIWFLALALLVLPEVALLAGQYQVVVDTGLAKTYGKFLFAVALPFTASVFNTIMYKNAFEAIPGRIKEVSLVDGAGGWKYLVKVAFPMVMPTTLTICILTALASWNSYLWPSLISTISDQKLDVVSVWLFRAGINPDDPESGANTLQNVKLAASLLVILPMFIVYLLARKRIMAAISRQGSTIKG